MVQINFTEVNEAAPPQNLKITGKYSVVDDHNIIVEYYDHTDETWKSLGVYPSTLEVLTHKFTLPIAATSDLGVVSVRINHLDDGEDNHTIYLDQVVIY